jgi:hypothetical protein
MVPINQVIVGGDPLLGNSIVGNNIEEQLRLLEKYKQNLEVAKQVQQNIQPKNQKLIWDDIDIEVTSLSEEQKEKLFLDEDYQEVYSKLQLLVQSELLNLVKGKIESTNEGKELLQNQLKLVKKLKTKIIQETNKEIETFKKFREFSKNNPEITYEDFIKHNI